MYAQAATSAALDACRAPEPAAPVAAEQRLQPPDAGEQRREGRLQIGAEAFGQRSDVTLQPLGEAAEFALQAGQQGAEAGAELEAAG